MSEWPAWQPIETAPRDGTLVLAWDKWLSHYRIAQFHKGFWQNATTPPPSMLSPTHWMPLPEPPAP